MLGVVVPFMIASGIIFAPLSWIFTSIALTLYWANGRKVDAYLLMYATFLLGDRNENTFDGFKQLRAFLIVLLFFFTIHDIVKKKYNFSPLYPLWIPFFVVATIGLFKSPVPVQCFMKTLSYALVIFVATHSLKYYIIQTKGRLMLDLITTINILLVMSLIIMVFFPSIAYFQDEEDASRLRLAGVMGNPNGLGYICALQFTFLLYARYYQNAISLPYLFFTLGLLTINLVLSGSRGALLSILIFGFLFFVNHRDFITRTTLKYILFPIGFVFLIYFGPSIIQSVPILADRLRIQSGMTLDHITSGRLNTWIFIFKTERITHVSEWFWFGKGFAYDTYFFMNLKKQFPMLPRSYGSPFNSLISIAMNNGVIGSLCMIGAIVFYFSRFRDKAMQLPLGVMAFIIAMSESTFASSLNYFTIFFYMFLSLYIQGKQIIIKNNESSISV
ncbi:MAG: O-antigen ligase family protein [Bacteroidia bacterium]|nr:O-antigen ligase family protein [Bacteroidia bacterium]